MTIYSWKSIEVQCINDRLKVFNLRGTTHRFDLTRSSQVLLQLFAKGHLLSSYRQESDFKVDNQGEKEECNVLVSPRFINLGR